MGIELSPADFWLACAVGAVIGLDVASWPQAMWSRPLVAATVGGWLGGTPAEGCLVGIWLEFALTRHPPFGGARRPETGSAAFIAGAAYGLAGPEPLIGLPAAAAAGWAAGWAGAYSVALLRGITVRFAALPGVVRGGAAGLAMRHRAALLLDTARAGGLTAALLVPSAVFISALAAVPPSPRGAAWTAALAAVGLAGVAGVSIRQLGARRGAWPLLAAGGALGAALWQLL